MYVFTASTSDSGGGGGSSAFIQLSFFVLIGLAMYFLMIRPQRRRQRAQSAMQRAIEIGDEVMTTSGLYGFVTGFDGDIAWLEIDDNVQVRLSRAAIQRKVDTVAGDTAEPSDDGTRRGTKIASADDDETAK